VEHIVIPIVTGLVGLVTGLAVPWVKWEIEKRRDQRAQRKKIIEEWRTAVEATDGDLNVLGDGAAYSSLRPLLTAEVRQQVENPRLLIVADGRGTSVNSKKQKLFDEITRIEREWNLT
jgi:hypothetical protein